MPEGVKHTVCWPFGHFFNKHLFSVKKYKYLFGVYFIYVYFCKVSLKTKYIK